MNPITLQEIERWLKETDQNALEKLWARADEVRKATVGDEVHLRGLIEISNYCVRRCAYCGLSAGNRAIERYRMTQEEILECALKAVQMSYGTVVMQAGEDYGIEADWLAEVVREIKKQTPMAVTLSLGERPYEELKLWRQAGADRYLLRFETSDSRLYELIHPSLPGKKSDRFEILRQLQELGYEAGSGVMVGIPGQSYATLAQDIQIFSTMDLDMIGVGPFIPSPNTPLGRGEIHFDIDPAEQVPNSELMTYKAVALTRLARPDANIPSTTALATINKESGREFGLMRGANIVMPNLTPVQYREKYEIYPGKACINETAEQCNGCLRGRIASIGRTIGTGRGGRGKRPT
ncbi:MAG: [FeFe] hydrogenase H-cluster radical SAM maturase HydE [Anaerohalosphaeraceae bacterium]